MNCIKWFLEEQNKSKIGEVSIGELMKKAAYSSDDKKQMLEL